MFTSAHANLINKARTAKLIAKNKAILKLLNKTQLAMIDQIKNKSFYAKLLRDIIVEVVNSHQGLIKLMEEKVFIRCLPRDIPLVKEIINDCVTEYKKIIKAELNLSANLDLQVDEKRCLEERKVPDYQNLKLEDFTDEHERTIKVERSEDTLKCFGGVILSNDKMNILCKNTLDVRVQQSFADCLPEVREMLFGKIIFEKKAAPPKSSHK